MPTLTVPLPAAIEREAAKSPFAREAACRAGVALLKARSSQWPVDTGRSKKAFVCVGKGARSQIQNPVHYSPYVEAGYPNERTRDSAQKTLEAGTDQIIRVTKQFVVVRTLQTLHRDAIRALYSARVSARKKLKQLQTTQRYAKLAAKVLGRFGLGLPAVDVFRVRGLADAAVLLDTPIRELKALIRVMDRFLTPNRVRRTTAAALRGDLRAIIATYRRFTRFTKRRLDVGAVHDIVDITAYLLKVRALGAALPKNKELAVKALLSRVRRAAQLARRSPLIGFRVGTLIGRIENVLRRFR